MSLRRDDVDVDQAWRHRETGVPGLVIEVDRESVYVLVDAAVQQVPIDWLLENCELLA